MNRYEVHLRAMGSDCHLVVVAPTDVTDVLTERLDQLEARWSRFRPSSDLSRLAVAQGAAVRVHPDTMHLVACMVEARRRSDGWYDPTMLTEVVAAGYDRDLAQLSPPDDGAPVVPAGVRAARPAIVVADGTVTLPAGVGLDPGSIGKGLAADLLVEAAVAGGAGGAVVNLGGDVRVRGHDERGAPWGVVVADDPRVGAPAAPQWATDGVLLASRDTAIMTSTVLRRRWSAPTGTAHHLLDPHTGSPTRHDLVAATVVAGAGWWADAAATALVAAGPAAPALAIRLGLTCRLTWADGSRVGLGGFDELARPCAGSRA